MRAKQPTTSPHRGGRPSRAEAEKLQDKILDAATSLFFSHGYGAVSIEKIAQTAKISKRTFYARFDDKAALFRAVVHRIIHKLRPDDGATDHVFEGATVEAVLRRIAPLILKAAVTPEAVALHRMVLAEAVRFPELALIMHEQSARQEAIRRIAGLLQHNAKTLKQPLPDANFAAEQFLFLVTAAPLRRALGMGAPLKGEELDAWAEKSVGLFLGGVFLSTPQAGQSTALTHHLHRTV